jgi:hypothetical protein
MTDINKWCQSCQQYKKPEVGKYIKRGGIKRFQCNSCIQRTSQSYLKRSA